MGYIRHRAVLAVLPSHVIEFNNDKEKEINIFIEELNKKIESLDSTLELILITKPAVNRYKTYIFLPDGSKIGWDLSDQIEKSRREFMEKMRKFGAEVLYTDFGGDEPEIVKIINPKPYDESEE